MFNNTVAIVFQATPLYNKIILPPATAKEVRKMNEHVSRNNRKMCWEDPKRWQ